MVSFCARRHSSQMYVCFTLQYRYIHIEAYGIHIHLRNTYTFEQAHILLCKKALVTNACVFQYEYLAVCLYMNIDLYVSRVVYEYRCICCDLYEYRSICFKAINMNIYLYVSSVFVFAHGICDPNLIHMYQIYHPKIYMYQR